MKYLITKERINSFIILFGTIILPFFIYALLYKMKNVFQDIYEPSLLAPSAIIGSMIIALLGINQNYVNNLKNKEYDEVKEQLKYLYNPLNAIIEKNYKYLIFQKHYSIKEDKIDEYATKYYTFFLELRDTYLDNQVYGSLKLREAFHLLLHRHEREYRNYSNQFDTEKDIINNLAMFELNNDINKDDDSAFERLVENVIEVINEDICKIAKDKEPVKRYYQ